LTVMDFASYFIHLRLFFSIKHDRSDSDKCYVSVWLDGNIQISTKVNFETTLEVFPQSVSERLFFFNFQYQQLSNICSSREVKQLYTK